MNDKNKGNQSPIDNLTSKRTLFSPIEDHIREKAVDDPFARFLLTGWKQVVVVLIAVFVVVYLKNAYVNTQSESQQASADLFAESRQQFVALKDRAERPSDEPDAAEKPNDSQKPADKEPVDKEKARAEQLKKLEENLSQRLVALADAREPYKDLVPLYRGLLLEVQGHSDRLKEALPGIDISSLSSASAGLDKMVKELSLMVAARAKLDKANEITRGRNELKALAQQAEYVNVSAAITFARVASSSEEKAEAVSLLETLADSHPEQAKLLEPELKRLKG